MSKYYYRVGDEAFGPVSSKEMRRLAREGVIRPDTYVRKGEGEKWVQARRIAGLVPDDAPAPHVEKENPSQADAGPPSPPRDSYLLRPAARPKPPMIEPLDDDEDEDDDDEPPRRRGRRNERKTTNNRTLWLLGGAAAIGTVAVGIVVVVIVLSQSKSKPANEDKTDPPGGSSATVPSKPSTPPPALKDIVGSWESTREDSPLLSARIGEDGKCLCVVSQPVGGNDFLASGAQGFITTSESGMSFQVLIGNAITFWNVKSGDSPDKLVLEEDTKTKPRTITLTRKKTPLPGTEPPPAPPSPPPPKKLTLADFVGTWKGKEGRVGIEMIIKADGGCIWSLFQGADGASTYVPLGTAGPPWTLILPGIGTRVAIKADEKGGLEATINGDIKLKLVRQ